MLEENRRIVAAQRLAQKADRILRIRGHGDAPAEAVYPLHFVRLAVPGIAAFEESAGNPHHHRRRESIRRAPAHGAAVVELLGRRIRVFAELNLRYGHEPGGGHTHGPPDDALL